MQASADHLPSFHLARYPERVYGGQMPHTPQILNRSSLVKFSSRPETGWSSLSIHSFFLIWHLCRTSLKFLNFSKFRVNHSQFTRYGSCPPPGQSEPNDQIVFIEHGFPKYFPFRNLKLYMYFEERYNINEVRYLINKSRLFVFHNYWFRLKFKALKIANTFSSVNANYDTYCRSHSNCRRANHVTAANRFPQRMQSAPFACLKPWHMRYASRIYTIFEYFRWKVFTMRNRPHNMYWPKLICHRGIPFKQC